MIDYEFLILEKQENETDDCAMCPYKGHCNNKCEEIHVGKPLEIVYPFLFNNRK